MKIENISLSAIKYFIDAVDLQSLTRASEKNHVSRPAVSQSIRRLEEWSGKQLLSHNKRLFILTEEGQKFYRIVKVAYENFQLTIDQGANPKQLLNIGCSTSLVDMLVVPTLSKIKNVEQLSLKSGTTQQLRELLEAKIINITLSICSENRNKNLSKLIHRGNFILASLDGKIKDKIIVTEDRPEVVALKQSFSDSSDYVKIESWATGLKVARALNLACLIPDIFLKKPFKRIPSSFKFEYKIVLEHRPLEYLSDSEILFLKEIERISI